MEAFRDCANLSQVIFEGDLQAIPISCFASCSKLATINWPTKISVIEDYAFSNCGMLVELRIPDGVTRIGTKAFYHNRSLEILELPNSLIAIDDFGFADCIHLKQINMNQLSPLKIDENVFEGIDKKTVSLIAPEEFFDEYRKSSMWKEFNIIL